MLPIWFLIVVPFATLFASAYILEVYESNVKNTGKIILLTGTIYFLIMFISKEFALIAILVLVLLELYAIMHFYGIHIRKAFAIWILHILLTFVGYTLLVSYF